MRKILSLLFLMILSFNAYGQSFEATVNRNKLPAGETFVLTLELKDVDTNQSPDVKALSKDFTVMSVSNGYRTNIINGAVTKSRQWNLVLIPNHTGSLTIPTIALAGYQTKPIEIKVTDEQYNPAASQNNSSTAENSQFKVIGEVDNHNPYVQQQINYEFKIYDTGGLRGDAPMFLGGSDDWVIKIYGEPEIKTQIVNGRNLREITYRYALFPQKSGDLTIPAVRFNGYYLVKGSRQDPFARFFGDDEFFAGFGLNDVFATQKTVTLASQPITIKVKPAAIEDGWWLPSSRVELSAKFDDDKPTFMVGEPVSRTIYLKAEGVLDSQLPEIKFSNIEGLKQYPEKALRSSHVENGNIISLAQIRNVYIPQKSGEFDLPEVKVNWFNTVKGKMETAVLPSYKAYIKPSELLQSQPRIQVEPSEPKVDNQPTKVVQENSLPLDNRQIIWLLLGAFIGGIILTAAIFKIFTYITSRTVHTDYHKEVMIAAKQGDVKALRDALILWGKIKFANTEINSLSDISSIIKDDEFTEMLNKIREYLYSANPHPWQGKEFLAVFERIARRKSQKQIEQDNILPKLYK